MNEQGGDGQGPAPTVTRGEGKPPARATPGPGAPGGALVGRTLAKRYRLHHFLAAGGMGEVYQASDLALGVEVALKVLSTPRPDAVERFRREVKLARLVTHPNVCRTFDFDQDGELAFLTMELLGGESLAARLERGPLAPEVALELLRQAAAGLSAAHAAGVVHRDFKPSNVLLLSGAEGRDRVVVTDFGIAHSADGGNTLTGEQQAVVGTPAYMAPEQALQQRSGAAADVYALGVVAFEAVAGVRPLASSVERLDITAQGLRRIGPKLPKGWEAPIARALSRDPAARFPTPASFIEALTWPPVRRRVSRLVLAAAGVLVAVGAPLAWEFRGLPASDRRVAVAAHLVGSDAWLEPAVASLSRRMLEEFDERFAVVDAANANVLLTFDLARTEKGVRLRALARPRLGWARELASAEAQSAEEAFEQLRPALTTALADGQPARQPSTDEAGEMARLGTQSFPAFRAFRTADRGLSRELTFDDAAVLAALREAIEKDPGWAHPRALLLLMFTYQGTPTQTAEAEAARAVDGARDPAGRLALELTPHFARGDYGPIMPRLKQMFAQTHDRAVGRLFVGALMGLDQYNELISTQRRLVELWPDSSHLELVTMLRETGRADETAPLVARFVQAAPDNVEALMLQALTAADHGDVPTARRLAAGLTLLYGDGERAMRTAPLSAVQLLVGNYPEANRLADKLLQGKYADPFYGRYTLGLLAALQGRFSQAEELLKRSALEGEQIGRGSFTIQAWETLANVQALLGKSAERAESLDRLAAFSDTLGFTALGISNRFQARLERTGKCEPLAPVLATLGTDSTASGARRAILRAAALRGCATCEDVVNEGRAPFEYSTRGSVELGTCALRTGQLDLARATLEGVAPIRTPGLEPSYLVCPVASVVARFTLAQLLEKQGKRDEALRRYEEVLAFWGNADRPLPIVTETRAAIARLGK